MATLLQCARSGKGSSEGERGRYWRPAGAAPGQSM